jgi:hypothetical protein
LLVVAQLFRIEAATAPPTVEPHDNNDENDELPRQHS